MNWAAPISMKRYPKMEKHEVMMLATFTLSLRRTPLLGLMVALNFGNTSCIEKAHVRFPQVCGNAILELGEDCDGEELDGKDCTDFGFYGGNLSCSTDCTFDVTYCHHDFCGDGILNGLEDCDGVDLADQSCESLGYHSGGDL